MQVKILSLQQLNEIKGWEHAFFNTGHILTNGEIGYCPERNTIICCDSRNGHYTTLSGIKLAEDK